MSDVSDDVVVQVANRASLSALCALRYYLLLINLVRRAEVKEAALEVLSEDFKTMVEPPSEHSQVIRWLSKHSTTSLNHQGGLW